MWWLGCPVLLDNALNPDQRSQLRTDYVKSRKA